MNVKIIAFDADDTLWDNEHYFKQTADAFCTLLSAYLPEKDVAQELNKIAVANIPLYGFGIKGFMLSMIEACLNVSGSGCNGELIQKIIVLGKKMLDEPVNLIDGIEDVLAVLQKNYKLVVATKGDLLDQEKKLKKSGLLPFFHHIEIMSEKDENSYLKMIRHLDVQPEEFLMIGNSLKSDVIPVLAIGGHAIHIPYYITNVHEYVGESIENPRFKSLADIKSVLTLFYHK
jgi:putative hydrolase of the HAD superfamily